MGIHDGCCADYAERAGSDRDALPRIDSILKSYMQDAHVPGLVYGIVRPGRVEHIALAHGGGYPGYGSYVLLLPDYDAGIFVFANRTYAGPAGAVWDIALELRKAAWFTERPIPVSPALAQTYRIAQAIFTARRIDPGRSSLASNFLMDRSEANWAAELTRLSSRAGSCRTDAPIAATGALSGTFVWSCERGVIGGALLLAPTNPPTIQSLRLAFEPR